MPVEQGVCHAVAGECFPRDTGCSFHNPLAIFWLRSVRLHVLHGDSDKGLRKPRLVMGVCGGIGIGIGIGILGLWYMC